jgi:hypothetical protein
LGLLHELNRGISSWDMAHFVTIDGPGDVVWGPFHGVLVPVAARVEAGSVVVALQLVVAITIDDVH